MNLKEIRLIRMLAWVLVYLIVLFMLIFILVIPAVKRYKSAKDLHDNINAKYLSVQADHKTVYKRLKQLQAKNRKVVNAFENGWNEDMFVKKAKTYFTAIKMKPIDINSSDRYFKTYEINAMTQMQSPQNFYRFLDALSQMPFVVQSDFPIAFRSHGKMVEGIFRINVFEEKKVQSFKAENNSSKASKE